jgi:hypothetical protein
MERGPKGMGKEEAGETEREGGGHSCLLLPFFIVLFERGQHLLPPYLFFSFRTGAAHAAPGSFHFFSNGGSTRFFSFLFEWGSTCCPRVFSFCFEWGRHTPSPILFVPFLFFPFRTGGQCESHTAAPISFGFNRGQRVSHSCPNPFPFRTGAVCIPHAAPCFFRFRLGTA